MKSDPMLGKRRKDRAWHLIIKYQNWGYDYDEKTFITLFPNRPPLTDEECREIAVYVPMTWQGVRRLFPIQKVDLTTYH